MNLRKEIKETIREQVEMDSIDATEEIDEIRNITNVFFDNVSKKIKRMHSYFVLTDKNYGTECTYYSVEALVKLEDIYYAIKNLRDELYKAQ
jgi:abortive infection bacteriophage resistance protein